MGAPQIPTPGAMRRKTRGKKSQPRAKTTPVHRRRLARERHQQEAPKSSGLPDQRSTSHPQHLLRSPRREASPSAPSPHWRATDLCLTGGRRWRCCRPGVAWEARARWNPPAWSPARTRRRSRRKRWRRRAKHPAPPNRLRRRKRTQVSRGSESSTNSK